MNPNHSRSALKQDRRWPARDQLPATITITPIPFLGTSWYERRTGYWLRRIGFTGLWVFACVAFGAIDTGVLTGINARGTALWIVLGVLFAYIIASGGYVFISLRKQRLPRAASRTSNGRGARFGAGLGVLARNGSVVAQAFFVLVALLCGGVTLAYLVRSFLPEIDNERWARNALADQLDEEARIIERNRARQARRHPTPQETNEP